MEELALHILDLIQNSLRAEATGVELTIEEDYNADLIRVTINDNGKGMNEEYCSRVLDPFTTTRKTRRVGLGLPLVAMTARQCNGDLKIDSIPEEGTAVSFTMQHSHWDRPPLGDMPQTITALLVGNPQLDLRYRHRVEEEEFVFDTREIRETLGSELEINNLEVLEWIKGYLEENLESLYDGGED